jgi:hypothetical protein
MPIAQNEIFKNLLKKFFQKICLAWTIVKEIPTANKNRKTINLGRKYHIFPLIISTLIKPKLLRSKQK